MADDYLAPCVARPPAAMIFTVCIVNILALPGSNLRVTLQCRGMLWKANVFLCISVIEDWTIWPRFVQTMFSCVLAHWGRVTHICVSRLTITGSDNGLSPDRRQAIILTNVGLLLIGPFGTNFSEILIEILLFSFKKMRLEVSSAKSQPFCLGLNVLIC